MEPDTMILVFWMLSFMPAFSLSSFTFIKRLFSCSSLSAIRVVSSMYLRLLIFLPAILIPACASSSPAFHMMYSAYKLNKQGDNIQAWCTPFPICNQSIVSCPVLTVASWPAYGFLKRQVRLSGIPISWRIFQFIVICVVKDLSVINEAEVFLEFSWFFYGQFIYCWSLAWRILSITFLACEMSSRVVVWTFFGIVLLWDWNKNWPFPVLWPLLSFPNLLA